MTKVRVEMSDLHIWKEKKLGNHATRIGSPAKTLCVAMLMSVSAGAVGASETLCRFDRECVEGETCSETSFGARIAPDPETPQGLVLYTEVETLRGTGVHLDGPTHMTFIGDTALHLISVSDDAAARYTVHLEGPLAVIYIGTCEVVD